MMVEVFKTNVVDQDQAKWIIDQIQSTYRHYKASFDLEDCDRILVVKCADGAVVPWQVIDLLKSFDCHAEVLPGD